MRERFRALPACLRRAVRGVRDRFRAAVNAAVTRVVLTFTQGSGV